MNYKSHFKATNWLWKGTENQAAAIETLESIHLFEDLKEFNPVFAGTIPIGVEIDGSDIDILCEVKDFGRFQSRLRECFESQKNFLMTEKFVKQQRSLLCRFEHGRFRIEIFAQKTPVDNQDAYIHMIVEARMLDLAGENARQSIRKLKMTGLKTEPAFAKYFGIEGDPYSELLKMATLSDDELKSKLKL